MSLEDRITILEAAVAKLLRASDSTRPNIEARLQRLADEARYRAVEVLADQRADPPLPPGEPAPPQFPPGEPSLSRPTSALPALAKPLPHPDWLPVLHMNGSAACGLPGVYLVLPVSGVYKATPEALRILPRIQDAETGFWIVEPYREPRSDDVVRCVSCGYPVEVWTNRDLDYRPYLLDEVGQPMYPRKAQEAAQLRDTDTEALLQFKAQQTAEREQARRDEQRQEASLLQLKEQAQQLRASAPWMTNNAP